MKKKTLLLLCISALLTTLVITFIGCNSNKTNPLCNHNVIADETIEATCTHPGYTGGEHCSKCGIVITEPQITPQLEHSYVIDDPIVATCSTNGKTTGCHCSICGTVFVPQNNINKAPHEDGAFIGLPINAIDGITNPGLYTCKTCGEEYYDTVKYEDINLPIISITGDMSGISKDVKKQVMISYSDGDKSFEYNSTIKVQGATSSGFPKKNYNIQFFKDDTYTKKQKVEINNSWGGDKTNTLLKPTTLILANQETLSQQKSMVI